MLDALRAIFKEELKAELEPIKAEIKAIGKKMDSVYEQTADLTEFRTEMKQGISNIQKDLNTMELVTSKNWNDIAQLKAVK